MDDSSTNPLEGTDPFEALLAQCITRHDESGPLGVEELLAEQPEHAQRLRSRLAALSRLGMLGDHEHDARSSIGPYRLLRRLGGNMAEVHLAEDQRDGRRVAVKLGPRANGGWESGGERAAERFAREVRAVMSLEHPGIVPILQVGEEDGRPWFAMEFVEGIALDGALRAVRGLGRAPHELTGSDLAAVVPDAPAEAFGDTWVRAVGKIVLDVAEALSAAHERGVVHRDVKPSNIVLLPHGRAQILDFGLAHLEDLPTLTRSGEFAGTPAYVSPEQLAGSSSIDGRTDVFSLGVTLYELLALRRPFEGSGPVEVLAAIQGKDPLPLRHIAPHVPTDLETLCHRALEKERGARYANMEAFAEDLRRFLALRPILARPPGFVERVRQRARRRPWAAAAVGLALVLLIGAPIALLVANTKIRAGRDDAQTAAETAGREAAWKGAVVEHLVGHFESSGGLGTDAAARALLDRGVERLGSEFDDQPRVRAALMHASARAYLELGLPQLARPLLDRAFALLEREETGVTVESAGVLGSLARVHLAEGRPEWARDLVLRALALDPRERQLRTTLASALLALGEPHAARVQLELANIEPGSGHKPDEDELAAVWVDLAWIQLREGEAQAAREALLHALWLRERDWSPDPLGLAEVHDGLAAAASGPGAAEVHRRTAERLRGSMTERLTAAVPSPYLDAPPWSAAYEAAFARGVSALQAGRLDEAYAAFEEALSMRPSPAVAAYNLACCRALAGELEEAAAWLGRAHEYGFACVPYRLETLRRDPDLAALRDSDVGAPRVRALEAQWVLAQEHARKKIVRRPTDVDASEPTPLLVVLHENGGSSQDALDGPWAELARARGATLLAPNGPFLTSAVPREGTVWSGDPRELWSSPGEHGADVVDSVRELMQAAAIDPERIWVAGEGHGGLLALQLMLENPGLFRGALLLRPALHAHSVGRLGKLAAALGARIGILLPLDRACPDAREQDARKMKAALEEWLVRDGGWGGQARIELLAPGEEPVQALSGLFEWAHENN